MHKFIEISVIYKGTTVEEVPDAKGLKHPVKVWSFDLLIEHPSTREKSGTIDFETETFSDKKFTPGNQIFMGLSLDFRKNRGSLYTKIFDDYNTLDQSRDLRISTNGEVFINKGFEIVTGDTHKGEAALVYTDHHKNVVHFYKGENKTRKLVRKSRTKGLFRGFYIC